MNALAERYAAENIGSIFLYTNEAHPGEYYPHHTSMEQKFAHAEAIRDIYGVARPILVDSLDGACHRTYGSMPNMSWIFNRAGVPVYKSDWTDSRSIELTLKYLLEVGKRRKNREHLAPFRVERIDFRNNDREAFTAGLARNGPKAVREFQEAFAD